MGVQLAFPCGCKFDLWFRFDKDYDPIGIFLPEGDKIEICEEHEKYLFKNYDKMLGKVIQQLDQD